MSGQIIRKGVDNMEEAKEKSQRYRSWFAVLNNPEKLDLFQELNPADIVEKACDIWTDDGERLSRSCAINYEIGDKGTPHLHMILTDKNKCSFNGIKKVFGSAIHLEVMRGGADEAKDYLAKVGKHKEKNHTIVIETVFRGKILGNGGKRNDLDEIENLIEQGYTPQEILNQSFSYFRFEKMIKAAYLQKRISETPIFKENMVTEWHVGLSGSGKTYCYKQLCDELGAESIYIVTDYDNQASGAFDDYLKIGAPPILFLDEVKGNSLSYGKLLSILSPYSRMQTHSRYSNTYNLWTRVIITSIYPPEDIFKLLVAEELQNMDSLKQLLRRLTKVVYHYKVEADYRTFAVSGDEYINYVLLKSQAAKNDKILQQVKKEYEELKANVKPFADEDFDKMLADVDTSSSKPFNLTPINKNK